MGRADRANPSPHTVIDPELPEQQRRQLREALSELDRARAAQARNPRYVTDADDPSLLRSRAMRESLAAGGGRYITSRELDPQARDLLARAQQAIRTVLASEVHRAGLLDRERARVQLPYEEWEIARSVRGLSRIRAQRPGIAGDEPSPATAALDAAERRVAARVEALERYAQHVLVADIDYTLTGNHAAALADIDMLTDEARAAGRALQESIDRASQLGAEPGFDRGVS